MSQLLADQSFVSSILASVCCLYQLTFLKRLFHKSVLNVCVVMDLWFTASWSWSKWPFCQRFARIHAKPVWGEWRYISGSWRRHSEFFLMLRHAYYIWFDLLDLYFNPLLAGTFLLLNVPSASWNWWMICSNSEMTDVSFRNFLCNNIYSSLWSLLLIWPGPGVYSSLCIVDLTMVHSSFSIVFKSP